MAPTSLSGVVQSCGILLCVSMVLALLPGIYRGELFHWHPFFMTVGFLGFMSEGIVAAFRFRPMEGAPRVAAIQNHAWVQAASSASVALGFYVIYRNKARPPAAAAAPGRRLQYSGALLGVDGREGARGGQVP